MFLNLWALWMSGPPSNIQNLLLCFHYGITKKFIDFWWCNNISQMLRWWMKRHFQCHLFSDTLAILFLSLKQEIIFSSHSDIITFCNWVWGMDIMFFILVQSHFYILMTMENAQQYLEQVPESDTVLLYLTCLNHRVTQYSSLFIITHPWNVVCLE